MDKGIALINALCDLTRAVTAMTEAIKTGYIGTFEEIRDTPQAAEEPKKPPAPKDEPVTFVQLRSRLSEISRSGKTAEVKELIAKYGAAKLSDIAESDYAAVLAEAEGL